MAEERTKRRRLPVLGAVLALLIALGAFLAYAVGAYRVDTYAMRPTLHSGDILLVWQMGVRPRQGDVVVYERDFPSAKGIDIKRVIAVAGQSVHIDYASNSVFVDGVRLDEPYVEEAMREPRFEHISDITVPEGSVFVLGDNRNSSVDSRDASLGPVACSDIIGRVLFVF